MIKYTKLAVILLCVFLLNNCSDSKKVNISTVKKQIKPENEYLLKVENLTENRRTVKPGENLVDIFGPFNITYNKVVELADEISKVYSVKSLILVKNMLFIRITILPIYQSILFMK